MQLDGKVGDPVDFGLRFGLRFGFRISGKTHGATGGSASGLLSRSGSDPLGNELFGLESGFGVSVGI